MPAPELVPIVEEDEDKAREIERVIIRGAILDRLEKTSTDLEVLYIWGEVLKRERGQA